MTIQAHRPARSAVRRVPSYRPSPSGVIAAASIFGFVWLARGATGHGLPWWPPLVFAWATVTGWCISTVEAARARHVPNPVYRFALTVLLVDLAVIVGLIVQLLASVLS